MRQTTVFLGSTLPVSLLVLTWILSTTDPVLAQPNPGSRISRTKPENAGYVGLTKCAACHFDQYKDWKTSGHGKAFEILPAKYKKNSGCLKCHATGLGKLNVQDNSFYQSGVSCEACSRISIRNPLSCCGWSLVGRSRLRNFARRLPVS